MNDKSDLVIKNNSKRNTDSIIQKGYKEIDIINKENSKKKESRKVKTKTYNNHNHNHNKSKDKDIICNNLNYIRKSKCGP